MSDLFITHGVQLFIRCAVLIVENKLQYLLLFIFRLVQWFTGIAERVLIYRPENR